MTFYFSTKVVRRMYYPLQRFGIGVEEEELEKESE